jgi:hypothetical protein
MANVGGQVHQQRQQASRRAAQHQQHPAGSARAFAAAGRRRTGDWHGPRRARAARPAFARGMAAMGAESGGLKEQKSGDLQPRRGGQQQPPMPAADPAPPAQRHAGGPHRPAGPCQAEAHAHAPQSRQRMKANAQNKAAHPAVDLGMAVGLEQCRRHRRGRMRAADVQQAPSAQQSARRQQECQPRTQKGDQQAGQPLFVALGILGIRRRRRGRLPRAGAGAANRPSARRRARGTLGTTPRLPSAARSGGNGNGWPPFRHAPRLRVPAPAGTARCSPGARAGACRLQTPPVPGTARARWCRRSTAAGIRP